MYIINLTSEIKPVVLPWGETKAHVPLNVREVETTDENGEEKAKFIYDCVEKVDKPVNTENIMKAAAKAKFGDNIAEYVALNVFKTDDAKIVEYTEFVKLISEQAKKEGYE